MNDNFLHKFTYKLIPVTTIYNQLQRAVRVIISPGAAIEH